MLRFEKQEEIKPVIDETQPFIDIDGNKHVTLESNVRCIFDPSLDNGNFELSSELAKLVKENKIYVCNRILDYCPGFGCVGLDMLALGTTNHVVFADTNEKSVMNCLETSKQNSILFYTTGYGLDSIGDLPDEEKYDVVVATMQDDENKYVDFFQNIYKYLTIYADIYLIEKKDKPSLKNSDNVFLNNIYYVKSFPLGGKMIMHYKLSHDHLK
jgi:hypothetical protein